MAKKVLVEDSIVRLQIWDTAGQERFRSMAPMYYRSAHCGIICYDITSIDSFYAMHSWLLELKRNLDDDIMIHIVGTKLDLVNENPQRRQVPFDMCVKYASKYLVRRKNKNEFNETPYLNSRQQQQQQQQKSKSHRHRHSLAATGILSLTNNNTNSSTSPSHSRTKSVSHLHSFNTEQYFQPPTRSKSHLISNNSNKSNNLNNRNRRHTFSQHHKINQQQQQQQIASSSSNKNKQLKRLSTPISLNPTKSIDSNENEYENNNNNNTGNLTSYNDLDDISNRYHNNDNDSPMTINNDNNNISNNNSNNNTIPSSIAIPNKSSFNESEHDTSLEYKGLSDNLYNTDDINNNNNDEYNDFYNDNESIDESEFEFASSCCHEISAKDDLGIDEVFEVITRRLVEQMRLRMEDRRYQEEEEEAAHRQQTVYLHQDDDYENKASSKCC